MRKLWITVFILLISNLLTSCSTTHNNESPSPSAPHDAANVQSDPIPLTDVTRLKFTLPVGSKAKFQLLSSTLTRNNNHIGMLTLDDTNCSSGHQSSLDYKERSNTFYTKYFTGISPWKSIITLTLYWDNETNQLITDINGEKLSVAPLNRVRFIKVTDSSVNIHIESIEHLSSF